MRLHDAPITSGSTNGHHFRFLDLAAELRNRIYEYAAEAPPRNIIPKPGNPPTISLTQVCRQIRDEFRKIYMQNVPFTVRGKDIKGFTNAFFASGHTNQRVLDGQRPTRVIYLYPPLRNVDILPLLEVKIAFPQTEITVIPDPADIEEHFYPPSYLWYKPGHVPHGVDMTLDREGQAYMDQMRQLYNMTGFEDWSGGYHDVAFEDTDVRNFTNSSRKM
ncbi:hypothetical protein J4E85_006490 [Alternaria conjuncta]|uniref:uncharacterized protein n=1 Tax=Alternaria conjuncta TaxID=181017 RepID=UPI0022205C51|nr:uncharacterized protein J4E85_006490 [Alternaria conjuncta]KAI4926198.1 hypothetical protein J4E85_006490 [Alternaria conjuncta]